MDAADPPIAYPTSNIEPLHPVAELRTDWLTGRSIIVAENRAQRPNEFAQDEVAVSSIQSTANLALAEIGLPDVQGVPSCPFCVGNESKTPPALFEQLDADGRWQVRVVPNMYPAVEPDPKTSTVESAARGAHEVIIESSRHITRASALSADELRQVLEAYTDRLRHWHEDGTFRYGLVFKNQGPHAGASIAHLHSQFVALPDIPPAVEAEIGRAEHDYRQHRTCPYCRLLEEERSLGERIVMDRDGFVAFCPFASLQPCEVWLLPDRHEPSFESISPPYGIEQLAPILLALLNRLELIVSQAAYNMLLRTAPWRAHCDKWCHWRLELLPRVNSFAGFEIATGMHINPLAPERAARQLRPT